MKVFVSSTVYDLLDVRADIASLLRSLNMQPVLSDDKLSAFDVQRDVNSIETCLVNIASSDEVIVILDKRYGPSLQSAGYPDISATHLEFRHAVKCKKLIHFFVRDRLLADHGVWKKNKRNSSLSYAWVQGPNDCRLFKFLDERQLLEREGRRSNWSTSFTSSVDLVQCLRQHFERRVAPEALTKAIYENRFPFFEVTVESEYMVVDHCPSLKLTTNIRNVGGGTAFNLRITWEEEEPNEKREPVVEHLMVPGTNKTMQLLVGLGGPHRGTRRTLILDYETPIGVSVKERVRIHGFVRPGPQPTMVTGVTLVNREFRRSDRFQVAFAD